ncbi:MAG TPA: membrane protein insertase YidC [Polyangiaceae bacterium]|jgi:YidC/Oxa1 family membrane protein insertase|nr:membrane protein insertase YidC [Polyangiaceae bacterium]
MDRSSIGRLLVMAALAFALFQLGPKLFGGGKSQTAQPLRNESRIVLGPTPRAPEQFCELLAPEFRVQLSTQGANIRHYQLLGPKYQIKGQPIDLSTTPDLEFNRQLRFDFHNSAGLPPGKEWNVDGNLVDWTLDSHDGKSCVFSYHDAKVELKKTIALTGRPYEITAEGSIKNVASRALYHALTVNTDVWHTAKEVKGSMFRQSPAVTRVECVLETGKPKRLGESDFDAGKFSSDSEHFVTSTLDPGDWYQVDGRPSFAAVSNAYFANTVAPNKSPAPPVCQLLIEEHKDLGDSANDGALYRARLAYPGVDLAPGQSADYSLISYIGPKERAVLALAGGGQHRFSELIDLGFFSIIAKVLVAFLLKVHSIIPNWGVAIIILTVTARSLLFPLAVPGIKGMIKMRELKPEIDAMNEKFKDDAQAKGLAQMELWRKHNVNPLKGCVPQMASMPVWFALYTTLQTAVELYHIPFLWLPDLSAADPLYILPFIIGTTSFMQQRLMPQQGDAAQQKMMQYMMPIMFTVFMLFLPAGLGVYMFTNGVLGIVQQQAVEWHVRRQVKSGGGSGSGSGDIKVKVIGESASKGKGKSGSSSAKLAGDSPLLGKGKAES